MSDTFIDPFEQFEARRRERVGKTILFEGEKLQLRPSVPADVLIVRTDLSDKEFIESLDERALMCLDPGSAEAWARLRDPNRDLPLRLDDLIWLVGALVAEASGLPTVRPVDSSTGPAATNGSSTAKSPSRAATRKR